MLDIESTIAALATPHAGAARGIVRLSGPGVVACLARCFQSADPTDLAASSTARCISGVLRLGLPIGDLPCDVYLWPNSRSYTRQPSAELHLIGSPPLLDAALATLCQSGVRLARPGEFTLRAFLAGRLDLTQAEAVLSVIDATSRQDLESALQQLAGGLAQPLHRLRDRLLNLLADLEAGLDFVDEGLEFTSRQTVFETIESAQADVATLRSRLGQRNDAVGLPRVVLCGAPNVGKSSLLNALAGEPTAIVSEVAGSTRDYLIRNLSAEGLDCQIIDTAGVLATDEHQPLAVAVQRRSQSQHTHADLRILCLDATRPLNAWETEQIESSAPQLIVWTKTDANADTSTRTFGLSTSSHTGAGIGELKREICDRLSANRETEGLGVASRRCQESLERAEQALHAAHDALHHQLGDELVAAELRLALDELGQIVGAVYTDDVLDRIFSRFCIGK